MNTIIAFFSVIIFVFAGAMALNLFHENGQILDRGLAEATVREIQSKVDIYCRDPFTSEIFDVDYPGQIEMYVDTDKVCTFQEDSPSDYIYCKKFLCEVQMCDSTGTCAEGKSIIFEEGAVASIYRFVMTREGQKIKIQFDNS